MMNKETILEMIKNNNNEIDRFVKQDIPERIGSKNGKCTFGQWCNASQIMTNEIYPKSMALLQKARAAGFDVKIDMQSYKLSYCGMI